MFGIRVAGTKIDTSAGVIEIIKDISSGGEGQGYMAKHNGRNVFYKQFHRNAVPPLSPEDTLKARKKRTKWLVDQALHKLDPRINAPYAYVDLADEGGYVCQWIDNLLPLYCEPENGQSFLGAPRPYAQRIGVLGQLVDLLEMVHSRGVSHGDLNSDNIGVVITGDSVTVTLIDWSNFSNGDASMPPLMAGSEGSMAWWVRAHGKLPDMRSDTYSLGIHSHELLLGRPVVAGCSSIAEMLQRLERGDLAGDPLRGRHLPGNDIGVPFEALAPEIASMLRLMLQPRAESIPTIGAFARALRLTLPCLTSCSDCGIPFWWHAARHGCPKCGRQIESALELRIDGKSRPIQGLSILGRDDLGGDEAISGQHLRIIPVSLGRGNLKVLGRNGIKRQRAAERVYASQGQEFDIISGDQLEIATSGGSPLIISVA